MTIGKRYQAAARRSRQWAKAGISRLFTLPALLLLSVGCVSVQLVPLRADANGESVTLSPEVEVRADAVDRDHLWAVPSGFTPVRIAVRNVGSAPVQVELADIQLAGGAHELGAIPPNRIPVRRRVASLGMDPGSPFLAYQSIGGAGSRYGRTESLAIEPSLGPEFEPTFGQRDTGRAEILQSAFSGGAIASGKTREGFVYFRHVPKDVGQLTLKIAVRSASGSAPASVVEIVYAVHS
jgi:hypothetical protein